MWLFVFSFGLNFSMLLVSFLIKPFSFNKPARFKNLAGWKFVFYLKCSNFFGHVLTRLKLANNFRKCIDGVIYIIHSMNCSWDDA